MTVAPAHDAPSDKRTSASKVWTLAGVALAVAAVAATYVIIRFVSSPAKTAIIVVALLLIALTVVGYLGTRRGSAAGFVAVALILPYLVAGAAALASAERVADELSKLFSDTPSDTPTDTPGQTSDANGDGIPDDEYAEVDCESLSTDNSADTARVQQLCADNGGFQPGD
jgi:hypothetical protein